MCEQGGRQAGVLSSIIHQSLAALRQTIRSTPAHLQDAEQLADAQMYTKS